MGSKAVSFPACLIRSYLGTTSPGALSHFLTVLRARPVRLAISLRESWSRSFMRLTLPIMSMVITLNPLLKVSAGQWNTLVNFASALCGLPDQICIGTNTAVPQKGGLSLDEWLARPHVMLALKPDAHDEIERSLAAKGLKRRIAVALPHWSAAVELLEGTDLILTIARRAIGPLRAYHGLRQFAPPPELALPKMAYQQAWHMRKDADPALSWLRQAVKTRCNLGSSER